jgi:eukaryotic-like serine/threonine-protein kinase
MDCPRCHSENRDDSKFCSNCAAPLGQGGGAGLEGTIPETLQAPVVVLKPGSLVAGKYRIVQEAGAGGMGIVYKAEDLKLKRPVALKFLPPHLMDSPELKERFLIEAQAAAALSHPNICTIYEVGESEDRPYIAMEYVEGETLRDRVKKGPLEPREAVDLVDQVAAGLGEAHGTDIIHRDVKSANIMVTARGRAKVMDFGLAKLRGASSLTKSQTMLGTVAYMSPEQAQGERLDRRTDIWSLGVVLYELLAGKLPFQGAHDLTVIYAILHKEPESLIALRPSLAPELDHVVGQALAKKPADRYQTMEELREDLAAVAEGLRPLKARAKRAAIRLAVLPFANLTGDPDQEYLSDGLTQEMITLLGRLHPQGLGVIARTSVMRYKNTDSSVDQIGRELRVEYVLEGSARREGSRIRVAADLIQVRDETQLWGDVFEREMAGILALQNDVAREVAKALALKLLPSEQASLAKARPVDPEAHEAYLRGTFHWMKTTPADLDSAERYFDLALEKDPVYAQVYVGRAWVWLVRNQFGIASPEEAGPKAKAAALRALELDESSAGAHEALASVRTFVDWDWDGARESFLKTIELNPNVASAQGVYAQFLAITGHGEEALIHSERAAVLDPFNPLIQSWHSLVLYMQRRRDEAKAVAQQVRRIQPDFPVAMNVLWYLLHEEKGMEEEATEVVKALVRVVYQDPRIEAALDEGYAQGGYAEAMRHGAEALIARSPETFCLPSDIGSFYLAAGEKDKAFEWFGKGIEVHDPMLPYLGGLPFSDDLHPDPRFRDLLRKMNLPVEALVSASEKQ